MQPGEPSSAIRERVIRARNIQTERFSSLSLGEGGGRGSIHCNAQMTERMLHQFAEPDAASLDMLRLAMERLKLSARAYSRILKVARTIADLEGPKAKIMLAAFYNKGAMGLTQDKRKAAQLWDEALEMTGKYYMDSAELLRIIGEEYKNTDNAYYKDVTTWLLNDAQPEEPATQILLALCYRLGRGVQKDVRRSNIMLQGISIDNELGEALYPLMDYINGN